MTFLGLEQPVTQESRKIFDPTMANMVLQALQLYNEAVKNEYERGLKEMDEFTKTYGDFVSPFQNDMDRYGLMMGNIQNVVNDAYAHGVDLLKSPEGRLLVKKLTNSINPREFNNMRSNAKLGYLYLANIQEAIRKGEFDLDYENFRLNQLGLGNFNDFSSADGAIWNQTGPGIYQDINKWTHHLFDNMELSYDPELSKKYPGFMAYSKNKETMRQIVSNNIAGMLNTSLGKYRLSQLMDQGLTEDLAIQALSDMIINSNWEESQVKLEQDPYSVLDYKDKLDARQASRTFDYNMKLLEKRAELGIGNGSRSRSTTSGSSGSGAGGKTPVSYYEPLYQDLVINTINNDPHRTSTFGNKEFGLDMGASLYLSQLNLAEDYFGDGTSRSIYNNTITSNRSSSFGFDPKIKWENGNAVLDMNPTTGKFGRTTSTNIGKTIRPDLSNSDAFKRKFNEKYNDYLDRMSLDYESGMFANTWNHGESKVSEVTQDGKTIERLRGKNYVYMAPEDINKIYSGKELAARASGATGKLLEDAIAETKRIRNALKSGNIIMRGSGKVLGAGLYDTGQYGAYARVHIANYDGSDGLSSEQDAYIMTPYQSTPNPNFSKDGMFNLEFDLTSDLSRKSMDNAAIRKLGVSSNTGTIDNTLPDPFPWYTTEGLDSFGFLDNDIEE